jgi:hypothetical protein
LNDAELKRRVGFILAQEERAEVDWELVERLCDELAEEIGGDAPLPVRDYLSTSRRRRSDGVFAHGQRSDLVRYLRSM